MKKIFVLTVSLLILLGGSPAFAYIMDGNLTDWGVTPFTDWVPDSATAYYTQENNTNRPGSSSFREKYDLEAMYFDSDSNYLYFAVISSNHYTCGWGEDLGIDLNGDGAYEYGVDIANHPGGLQSRGVYSVSQWNSLLSWDNVDSKWFYAPYSIKSGTYIGSAGVFNRYAGAIEPATGYPYTWIIEGKILRTLFGDIACGTPIQLYLAKIGCLADWITVEGYCDGTNCGGTPPVPEPATMLLFGSGLLGLFRPGSRKNRL